MNWHPDAIDHARTSRESPLALDGTYHTVRGGALLFINNWTIFLRGRKVALEEGCQIPHTVVIAVRH